MNDARKAALELGSAQERYQPALAKAFIVSFLLAAILRHNR